MQSGTQAGDINDSWKEGGGCPCVADRQGPTSLAICPARGKNFAKAPLRSGIILTELPSPHPLARITARALFTMISCSGDCTSSLQSPAQDAQVPLFVVH